MSRNLVLKPMFDGILFAADPSPATEHQARPDPNLLDRLKDTRSIFGFLFTCNQKRLKAELSTLHSSSRAQAKLEHLSLQEKGARKKVRIRSGPQEGIEGVVMGLHDQSHQPHQPYQMMVNIEIQVLGAGLTIPVAIDLLEEI